MKKVIGKISPCQRPDQNPALSGPTAGFGPGAQEEGGAGRRGTLRRSLRFSATWWYALRHLVERGGAGQVGLSRPEPPGGAARGTLGPTDSSRVLGPSHTRARPPRSAPAGGGDPRAMHAAGG